MPGMCSYSTVSYPSEERKKLESSFAHFKCFYDDVLPSYIKLVRGLHKIVFPISLAVDVPYCFLFEPIIHA